MANRQQSHVFVMGGAGLVSGAALLSVASAVLPQIRALMPSMNLVDIRYGHSHLADLLIFAAPIIWYMRNTYRVVPFVYGVVLLSTFARGAWMLVALFFSVLYICLKPSGKARRGTVAVSALVVVGLYLLAIKSPLHQRIIRVQTAGARVEYWRQAIVSFAERPVLGSGPGTFSLASQRLQKSAGQSSWFAHSLPLQLAAETGLIGFIAFMWLVGVHAVVLLQNKTDKIISWAVILLFIYSLFEFVLDYQVTWLLFWAGIGVVSGNTVSHRSPPVRLVSILIPAGFISVFYLLWSASSLIALTTNRSDLAFYVAPFDVGNAVVLTASNKGNVLPQKAIDRILYFHKKNPAVLFELSKLHVDPSLSCEKLILLNRTSVKLQQDCANLLFDTNTRNKINALLFTIGSDVVPKDARWRLSIKDFSEASFLDAIAKEDLTTYYSASYKPHAFAKLMYNIGLRIVDDDPLLTKRLWLLARDIQPEMSYYSVELASLETHKFRDVYSAKRALARCAEVKVARKQCLSVLRFGIPPIGLQQALITSTQ